MVMIFKSHAHIIRSSLWERKTMYELNSFGVTSNFIAILRINFCNNFDVIAIIFFHCNKYCRCIALSNDIQAKA